MTIFLEFDMTKSENEMALSQTLCHTNSIGFIRHVPETPIPPEMSYTNKYNNTVHENYEF